MLQSSTESGERSSSDMADAAKVVVITGASSGIGRATALAFAKEGASVVLAARTADALAVVARECEAAGAQALSVPVDVTSIDAVRALAEQAIARFGRVDVWINNVGVGAVGLFDETPMEAHRRVIEANLLGHMHGAHAILPHFRARERGTLINMISLGGHVPAPFATAYSASKFGLRAFSEALRAELAASPGIHVCEVYPTFVDTPGMSHGANYSGHRVKPPPPMLDPRLVAQALVRLAHRPRSATYLGAPALPGIIAHALLPDTVGRIMMWMTERALSRSSPAAITGGNLFDPSVGHAVDGGFKPARPMALAHRCMPLLLVAGAAALAGLAARRSHR